MTKKELLVKLKEEAINNVNNTKFSKDIALNHKLKVKADHNRIYKGEGYLIGVDKPLNIFDINSKIALIFNEEDNNIYRVNTNFISFLDTDEILSSYKEWAIDIIEKSNTKSIKDNVLTVDYSLDTFLSIYESSLSIKDYLSAKDSALEEFNKKKQLYKDKKIADLSKWAATHTNKTGKATKGVAESIYKKFYDF